MDVDVKTSVDVLHEFSDRDNLEALSLDGDGLRIKTVAGTATMTWGEFWDVVRLAKPYHAASKIARTPTDEDFSEPARKVQSNEPVGV